MKKLITKTLLIFMLLALPSGSGGVTVESIAATVGDRIITTGDVITESKILKILSLPEAALPLEGRFSRELLDQMINRELVFSEALRSRFDDDGIDHREDMLDFEKKFSKPEEFPLFLKEEGLALGDMVEWFYKSRITRAYINEKISLMSYVGALDAEKYFRENEAIFEGKPFEAVEDQIRNLLARQKGEAFLGDWVNDLRKRGEIRYFVIPQDQLLR